MNTITPTFTDIGWKPILPIAIAISPVRKGKINNDIVLNVGFKEMLIRVGIVLILPILMLFDTGWIIYISPVVFYLFVSALIKFCIVKYAWRRYIKHEPALVSSAYGKNPNYPEESI